MSHPEVKPPLYGEKKRRKQGKEAKSELGSGGLSGVAETPQAFMVFCWLL